MKSLLILVCLTLSGSVFAQSKNEKLMEKKADFYATEAISYFKLKESKKQAIYEAKLNLIKAQNEMAKKKKEGEIPEGEEENYRKKNVAPHAQKVMDAIGVKWDKLKEFNEEVHPKMNALKN